MRSRASQARCLVVHHLGKAGNGTAHMHGQSIRVIIGGFQHQGVERVPDGHLLAFLQRHVRGVLIQLVDRGSTGQDVIHLRVLQDQKAGHDLGDRSRIQLPVAVF